MLSSLRVRNLAGLVAVAFVAACGDGESLPTNLDTAATDADVAAIQAAFEQPQVEAFSSLGYQMDFALGGGAMPALRAPAAVLREGSRVLPQTYESRVKSVLTGEVEPAAIPIQVLGRTFVWSTVESGYVLSDRTGAPSNGVRFVLYQVNPETEQPVEPLVEIGYAEITRATNSGSIAVYTSNNTKLLEYTATVGGSQFAPTLSVDGFVGIGVNQVTFDLGFAVSATTGTVTISWRTEMPARGLASRVTLGIGENGIAFGALMRNGLRRIEMGGTIGPNGGTITVRIGGRVFARLVADAEGGLTITNADGGPLTRQEAATLERIFEWFESAFDAPDDLLAPLYTVLDFELPA